MNLKSPAAEYTIQMIVWMTLYVGLLTGAILYIKTNHPTGPLLYALAILPALPIGGTIVTFLRFIERSDEYIRAMMVRRVLIAMGLTLFLSTAIGFIENFTETQLIERYLVYPMFWACFGLVSPFVRGSK
ncbi:hypothetical protein [Asticcacaulis sp. YBE204]|uniref:hypothetical protein n=1 Tax=Asticcacaulis sp. YBE204 TaxID=1282363 RepID=UPI0003C40100|nr:hypothetical protein [Asticcacaulis sp. YBE204]ESQ80618.1 membrane protein [Asticcacaulis sp. YBE204]